jgi:hypothetical protein
MDKCTTHASSDLRLHAQLYDFGADDIVPGGAGRRERKREYFGPWQEDRKPENWYCSQCLCN